MFAFTCLHGYEVVCVSGGSGFWGRRKVVKSKEARSSEAKRAKV